MLNKADSKDPLFFISSSITEPQQGTLTQRLKKTSFNTTCLTAKTSCSHPKICMHMPGTVPTGNEVMRNLLWVHSVYRDAVTHGNPDRSTGLKRWIRSWLPLCPPAPGEGLSSGSESNLMSNEWSTLLPNFTDVSLRTPGLKNFKHGQTALNLCAKLRHVPGELETL